MLSQQNLIDALYLKIKDSIGAEVGNRIYENEAEQDAALPLCVYTVVADTPLPLFVTDGLDADVQVLVYGWKRLGAKAIRTISDSLFADLHRFNIVIEGYDYGFVDGTIRGIATSTDDIVSIRTEFNIVGSEETNVS